MNQSYGHRRERFRAGTDRERGIGSHRKSLFEITLAQHLCVHHSVVLDDSKGQSGNVLLLLLLHEDPGDFCELGVQDIVCFRGRTLGRDVGRHRGGEGQQGQTEDPKG